MTTLGWAGMYDGSLRISTRIYDDFINIYMKEIGWEDVELPDSV